jgi:hypothetical protein
MIKVETINATSIRVSWHKPSDEGASSISGYMVYYYYGPAGPTEIKTFLVDVTSELSVVINDLIPNREYVTWVVAINEQGQGDNMKNDPFHVFTFSPSKSMKLHSYRCKFYYYRSLLD